MFFLHYNLVYRNSDQPNILQITLVHYIADITQNGPDKEEEART